MYAIWWQLLGTDGVFGYTLGGFGFKTSTLVRGNGRLFSQCLCNNFLLYFLFEFVFGERRRNLNCTTCILLHIH